jgi:hypothetical protein
LYVAAVACGRLRAVGRGLVLQVVATGIFSCGTLAETVGHQEVENIGRTEPVVFLRLAVTGFELVVDSCFAPF